MTTTLVTHGPFTPLAAQTLLESSAAEVMQQFFLSEIDNVHTRRAYCTGAKDFFRFTLPRLAAGLPCINALHVSEWIADMKGRGLSTPTVKQRLAGLRMLFQALAREQVIRFNPVSVVKGPKHSVKSGKTPVIDAAEVRQILDAIDPSTLIGLRDRALIATMAYSFARISAVTALRVGDVFHQRQRLWLRLTEKGGKIKDVPCHHNLQEYLIDWMSAATLAGHPEAMLFQSFAWEPSACRAGEQSIPDRDETLPRQRVLTGKPMTQAMTWEMVQRRAKIAGLSTHVCNHTFRAAGITTYLANGGMLERAAHIAGHASTRTTQLYDRRPDDITLDEIERIRFGSSQSAKCT
ncbi:MAG: tyrosine-type recombinase/integrase [Proteobacteria bacterium]|nr:tyrosine-type recombinase/integrase [Pseudomonadota bacterium]